MIDHDNKEFYAFLEARYGYLPEKEWMLLSLFWQLERNHEQLMFIYQDAVSPLAERILHNINPQQSMRAMPHISLDRWQEHAEKSLADYIDYASETLNKGTVSKLDHFCMSAGAAMMLEDNFSIINTYFVDHARYRPLLNQHQALCAKMCDTFPSLVNRVFQMKSADLNVDLLTRLVSTPSIKMVDQQAVDNIPPNIVTRHALEAILPKVEAKQLLLYLSQHHSSMTLDLEDHQAILLSIIEKGFHREVNDSSLIGRQLPPDTPSYLSKIIDDTFVDAFVECARTDSLYAVPGSLFATADIGLLTKLKLLTVIDIHKADSQWINLSFEVARAVNEAPLCMKTLDVLSHMTQPHRLALQVIAGCIDESRSNWNANSLAYKLLKPANIDFFAYVPNEKGAMGDFLGDWIHQLDNALALPTEAIFIRYQKQRQRAIQSIDISSTPHTERENCLGDDFMSSVL